jgi:hypothetical protein
LATRLNGLIDSLSARNQSDLRRSRLRERFRGQRVAGVVLVSDSATRLPVGAEHATGPAVWPVLRLAGTAAAARSGAERGGWRSAAGQRVGGPAVGDEQRFGREPFQLRVLADGRSRLAAWFRRPMDRRSTSASRSPTHATDRVHGYPADEHESVTENNSRRARARLDEAAAARVRGARFRA